MMLTFSLFELFGAISSFLGMLLIVLILTKRKGKSSIKISLIIFILTLILIIILGDLNYSGKIEMFPHLLRIDSPIHYLLGPAGFFYVYTSLKRDFKFRYIHLLVLLPFVLNIIHFMPLYFSSASTKLNYYNGFATQGSMIMKRQYLIKTISGWSYLIAQCYLFFKFIGKNKIDKKPNLSLIEWFTIFLVLQISSRLVLVFDQFNNLLTFTDPYQFAMNMTSLLLFSLSVALFFFPQLLYGAIFTEKPNIEKYSNSKLTDENKELILEKWVQFIDDSSKPYLNPKLAISEIANKLNTNPQFLSQVINEKTDMNFNDAINSFRIKEAKLLLASDNYNKLTIEAIALKSGFNSKSPFYTAFKKNTGLTPKQFITSIEKV
ncbi:helix-turn-helix domain-containing protein [Formosa sp. PL04]|uniref:helix-turn-helix domain-containing protein n=1 Tax=Formosa sp. PL04 TaxID=3081755 RepID=UPI0029812669|nr:helix-turn-helix domain-containing protein [Formosa sp. PL04]MDW5290240.1 helix-turn-helix domain-containing protein [Formosa sp. PL04]